MPVAGCAPVDMCPDVDLQVLATQLTGYRPYDGGGEMVGIAAVGIQFIEHLSIGIVEGFVASFHRSLQFKLTTL